MPPVWEYRTKEKTPYWRVLDEEMTTALETSLHKKQFEYKGILVDLDKGCMEWPETGGFAEVRCKKHMKLPLVLPSFSTAIFGFDVEAAAEIGCRVVGEFLRSLKGTELEGVAEVVLIDFSIKKTGWTETLEAFKKNGSGVKNFVLREGDVSHGPSRGPCYVLANAANSRLYGGPKTGGINRAIHQAAGPTLASDTHSLHGTHAEVSRPYTVPLSPHSPLYQEGVKYVVHCVGPNMNPNRPNYIASYKQSKPLLEECYRNLMKEYARLLQEAVKGMS